MDGSLPNELVYFLISGDVDIYIPFSNGDRKVIHSLKEGEVFGKYSFFSGRNEVVYARSKNVVKLAVLNKFDFVEVIQAYPNDKE